jgi:hypothetical protein
LHLRTPNIHNGCIEEKKKGDRAVRKSVAGVILLFMGGLTGCASMDVQTDFDRGADFGRYKTYGWFSRETRDPGAPAAGAGKTEARMRDAVERTMSERGIRREAGTPADFLIALHVIDEENREPESWDYRLGYWGRGADSGG